MRLLILNVDVDNDIYEKTGHAGPIIGEDENIKIAQALALADPEDTDGNAIFAAVKTYRELQKEDEVEIATLTGHKEMGIRADREIRRQMEIVASKFKPEGIVFVTDGAADETVIPIIQSFAPIISIKRVTVKQSKELEKTYFVILDKLKEPQFAKVVFGVPGVILLILAFAGNLGVRLVMFLIGSYLTLKGFGIDDDIAELINEYKAGASLEKISFVFYLSSIPLLAIGLIGGLDAFGRQDELVYAIAAFLDVFLDFGTLSVIFPILGKMLDEYLDQKRFKLPVRTRNLFAVVSTWLILSSGTDWLLENIFLGDWILRTVFAIGLYVAVLKASEIWKQKELSKIQIKGKDAYTETGAYLGQIMKLDGEKVKIKGYGGDIVLKLKKISDVRDKKVIFAY